MKCLLCYYEMNWGLARRLIKVTFDGVRLQFSHKFNADKRFSTNFGSITKLHDTVHYRPFNQMRLMMYYAK